ncbi:MAG TPA: TRAP transporter small permease [Myxococcota bacterium]|nr:TRAP transporter small permease [Myxococcota bacterium]
MTATPAPAAPPATPPPPTPPPTRLARLDERLYRLERAVASLLFLVMGLVVFVDVLHRVFSRPDGRVGYFLYRLLGGTGVSAETLQTRVAPVFILLATFGLIYGALRTRRPDPGRSPPSWRTAAFRAALLTALGAGLVQGFLLVLPSGLVWAPYFALCAMLWVGFLGASMATYRKSHLALEMGEKIWPEAVKPYVKAAARFVTAAFCTFLMVLAWLSALDHYRTWTTSDRADLIPSVEWPKWAVFIVLPLTFFTMAVRFARQSVDAARGRDTPGEGELPGAGVLPAADTPADAASGSGAGPDAHAGGAAR